MTTNPCYITNIRHENSTRYYTVPTDQLMSLAVWCNGNIVRHIDKVTPHWDRLVPGWVTIFGCVYHLGILTKSPMLTQPHISSSVAKRSTTISRLVLRDQIKHNKSKHALVTKYITTRNEHKKTKVRFGCL